MSVSCLYAECFYAECCYTECRYTECRYTECLYAGYSGVALGAQWSNTHSTHNPLIVGSNPNSGNDREKMPNFFFGLFLSCNCIAMATLP